jgi:hypothetical protein
MKDRFARLADLTRGAALVGLGTLAATGCSNESSSQPPPATGSAAVATTDPAGDSGASGRPFLRRKFPIPNAMRPRVEGFLSDAGPPGDSGAPPDAGAPGSTPGSP